MVTLAAFIDSAFRDYNKAKNDWVKMAVGVVMVGTTVYIGHKLLASPPVEPPAESSTLIKVDLMAHEKITMAMMPAVTTITKFDCNGVSPEPFLRSKLADIMRRNAWLCGHLIADDVDGMRLVYEPIRSKASIDEVAAIVSQHFEVIEDFDLPEGISYAELQQRLEHLQVKKGNACVNKPDEVLFKVFLVHVKDRNEVLVVFSLSHVLADGYTFYKLHNMLDKNTPVTAMEVVRSTRYESEIHKLKGADEVMGPLAILGMIGCATFRPTMRMHIVKVNPAWVEAQKADFAARRAASGDNKVGFVSTNDVLTAWHNSICRSDFQLMSLNCRGRVASFKPHQAGNYENHVMYHTAEDGSTPEAVRRSLSTYRNASNTTPDTYTLLRWNSSISSNWCSFYQQIDISDDAVGSSCTHKIHLPVIKSNDLSMFREGVCIFKFDAQHTGLLVFTRILTPEILESSGVGTVVAKL